MSLTGKAEQNKDLRGKLNGLHAMQGYSAYEVAVINGFDGTVDEWMESLKGEKGDDGKQGIQGVSGVYVGSGEMPEGYNVQIDPNGETLSTINEIVDAVIAALPVYDGEVVTE